MNRTRMRTRIGLVMVAAMGLAAGAARGAVEFYLRAGVITNTMPDGTAVVMWGFAQDSAFGAMDGTVTAPGPTLVVPPEETNVTLYVDNDIPCPLSLVIPGQIAAMTAVRHDPMMYPQFDGRVRSFTHETPMGNAAGVAYHWPDFKPGTYIYHSGTHVGCHVQMGLYGAIVKDQGPGLAYPSTPYDTGTVLVFSEIDPAFHEAVVTGNYGPGKAMTSMIHYKPRYFLVNGEPYTPGQLPIAAGTVGQTTLLRCVNVCLDNRIPVLNGQRLSAVAEDGQPYPFPVNLSALDLPAMKTRDALFVPAEPGTRMLYDRRLGLVNGLAADGGMYRGLEIMP